MGAHGLRGITQISIAQWWKRLLGALSENARAAQEAADLAQAEAPLAKHGRQIPAETTIGTAKMVESSCESATPPKGELY